MIIAIEGIDGTGKTTVSVLLREALERLGKSVFLTKEPTDKLILDKEVQKGRRPENGISLFFRFTEDRFVHQMEIENALKSGAIVITDRYMLSSFAYQGPIIEPIFGSREKTVEWMNDVSEIIRIRPDLTFFLDLSVREALNRIKDRKERSGFEEMNYLEKVREYYDFLSKGDKTIKTIDASRSKENVVEEILRFITETITRG